MINKRRILSCTIVLTLISLGSVTLLRGHATREMLQVTHLKLIPPGGKAIRACVVEGGMIKITNHRTGTVFAYSPTVQDERTGVVSVKVYQVRNSGAGEIFEEVETVETSFKGARSTVKSPVYSIEVETIAKTAASDNAKSGTAGSTSATDGEGGGGGMCCVTCGDLTVCSNCTVTMSCGSCCTNKPNAPACDCGGGV